MISDQDLSELKERCKYAAAHGFQVGLAEHIAAELAEEAGEIEFEGTKHSADHLVALATTVEQVRSGQASGAKKAKAVAMSAKLEAKSEAKVEPEAKVEADPFPSQSQGQQGSSKKGKKKDDD